MKGRGKGKHKRHPRLIKSVKLVKENDVNENENDENKNDENKNDVKTTTSAKKKPKPNDIEKTVNKYELIYKTEDTVGEEEYGRSKQNVHQKTKPSVATSGVNIVRVKDPVFKVAPRGEKQDS